MLKLFNYMEKLVDESLEEILPHYPDICKCSKCILDIKAISLNNLPPCHVVTEEGALYIKLKNQLNLQEKANIATAVTHAIELVSKNPKH